MTMTRGAPLAALILAAGCGGSSPQVPPQTRAVGITVSGLAGGGLTLHLGPASPGQDLAVTADGQVQFLEKLAQGAGYAVTVKTQPTSPWQDCTVGGGGDGAGGGTLGVVDAAVTVSCVTKEFTVGGAVAGLTGPGLSLRLNGGPALAVDAAGDFTFPAPLPSGAAFAVTVATHPPSPRQACEVTGTTGQGTVQDQPVTSVRVTCRSDVHAVGGAVAGRTGGGLLLRLEVGGVVWSDDLPVSSPTFAFPAPVPEGEAWTVTVSRQPTVPWQTCTVTGGAGVMGTADVGTVAVACLTDRYAVGGHVAGLLRAGLTVRLTVDGVAGAPLAVDADGAFAFPGDVESGRPFLVAVETVPGTQACRITAPADVVAGGAVMAGAAVDVAVACGCAAGLGNCDGVATNGCEHDVTADLDNCGACARPCAFAHAGAICQGGACSIGACDPGFASCDGSAATGCEQATSSDPLHCGGCGVVCSPLHAPPLCSGGRCGHGACQAGWGDCDGNLVNGCEQDVLVSPAHCGTCGHACSLPNAVAACAAGQCAVGSCLLGFRDCDGQAANGCEANLATDAFNCQTCGHACSFPNAAGVCSNGFCGLGACNPGFANCDADAATGCESPVAGDPRNCGACGNVCSTLHGTAACSGSECGMSACDLGFGDCQGSAVPGCETDTTTSVEHCGSCGHACGAGEGCVAGSCVPPPSCRAILDAQPGTLSGPQTIDPDGAGGNAPVLVYCEMEFDGGGWTFFAHVNGDYQAGRLFEVDEPAPPAAPLYDPARADGNVTYGLGGSVYRHLGATELMASLDNKDPALTLGDKLVFYKFAGTHRSFTTGPVPCDPTDPTLLYRTLLGTYLAGEFAVCDATEWWPYDGPFDSGGEALALLSGSAALGTHWGSGMAPAGTIFTNTWQHDSWWYAR